MSTGLVKDGQTVTADGELVGDRIHGLSIRKLKSVEDKRGDITEMYDPRWEMSPHPMVFAYQVTVRPGAIRGWEMHKKQFDRIYISSGAMRWALFDHRSASPTHLMVNSYVFSELNRVLMIVPPGVIHAVQNIGSTDAVFVNFPTEPFNHADPDKWRVPLENDLIPFAFDDGPGW